MQLHCTSLLSSCSDSCTPLHLYINIEMNIKVATQLLSVQTLKAPTTRATVYGLTDLMLDLDIAVWNVLVILQKNQLRVKLFAEESAVLSTILSNHSVEIHMVKMPFCNKWSLVHSDSTQLNSYVELILLKLLIIDLRNYNSPIGQPRQHPVSYIVIIA